MGDQLTKAELDGLLADNSTGDITPARLRDMLESCLPSRGLIAFAAGSTSFDAAGDVNKAGNATALNGDAYRFGVDGNNKLVYLGDAAVGAELLGVFGVKCTAAAGQVVAVSVQKNGIGEGGELVCRYLVALGAADALSQVAVLASVALEQNDYLEVFVSNETSSADITIDHGSLRAAAFLT